MPAFVVLEHDHPALHWDLMLEAGEALRTWRLAQPPAAGVTTACESLPDHRQAYLHYEGPVSGGRGCVKRVMSGNYEVVEETTEQLKVLLCPGGERLKAMLKPSAGTGVATFKNPGN